MLSRTQKLLLGIAVVLLFIALSHASSTLFFAYERFLVLPLSLWRYPLPEGELPNQTIFHFPTYDERLKYYMSDWYNATNARNSNRTNSQHVAAVCRDSRIESDVPHVWSPKRLQDVISEKTKWGPNWFGMTYEEDALRHFVTKEQKMVFTFGDGLYAKDQVNHASYPMISKSRIIGNSLVLGFLQERRHYGEVKLVRDFHSWSHKKDAIVYRGDSTGERLEVLSNFWSQNTISDPARFNLGFAKLVQGKDTAENRKLFLKDRLSLQRLLKYKYLLAIPGNDVSSGLKWMLYSNSVVFMPPPHKVSWAMEDKLVPYVHYIPIREDLSDLPSQLEWAMQHDVECQKISRYATQYMMDLYVSEQAQVTNQRLQLKIGKRYHELYGDWFANC